MHSRGSSYQDTRSTGIAVAAAVIAEGRPGASVEPPRGMRTGLNARVLRNNLRMASAVILLLFVICHLTAHSLLLVSFERAEAALNMLMYPWRTAIGTAILVSALLAHYLNALWSIYVRHTLRLSRWELWQLGLGLCIPLLL